jgi:hypothetical protein
MLTGGSDPTAIGVQEEGIRPTAPCTGGTSVTACTRGGCWTEDDQVGARKGPGL